MSRRGSLRSSTSGEKSSLLLTVPSTMPILVPHLLLGLRTNVHGNCHFSSDDEIVYPVGAVIALHNYAHKTQKFIRPAEKGTRVNIVQVSPNRRIAAVAEIATKPIITLWDLQTYKKRCTLTLPSDRETSATRFVSLTFSFDSKFLYTSTGEPDWTLFVYKVDRGRLDSFARANNSNGTGTVTYIAGNPTDVNTIAIIGNNLLKMVGCLDFVWKVFGYNKADNLNVTTAAWLSQDRLLCGTAAGKIMFLENGDLRMVLNCNQLPVINLKVKEDMGQGSQASLKAVESIIQPMENEDTKVRCMLFFPRGLIFGYTTGKIFLYEMDSANLYIKRNTFIIPDQSVKRENEQEQILTKINHMALNVSNNKLIVSCDQSQLFYANLWVHEASSTEIPLTEYGYSLHNGPIISMDTCAWKPLVLTAGAQDRRLKLFNYENNEMELEQKWGDDIYSVALHPTGLYCLVGFSDKLRFLTVKIDEFVITREFAIRICRLCSFSTMGYLFAAINLSVINIYSTITFETMYTLKAHSGLITDLSWTADDLVLASCGYDGAVYEWSISKEMRLAETVLKKNPFQSVAINKEGKVIHAVSKDGFFREFVDSSLMKELPVNNMPLFQIRKSRLDQIIIIGGTKGIIINCKLPIIDKVEYEEYGIFHGDCTQLQFSFNDRWVLTASSLGELCFWKIHNAEGKAIRVEKNALVSTDILISKKVLEERLLQIKNLQQRLKELETEFNYQLRENETKHDLLIEELNERFSIVIEELKEKIESLETEHAQEMHNVNMEIKQMQGEHNEFINKLELTYTEKLIFEYEKYAALELKLAKVREANTKLIEQMKQERLDSEQAITRDFLEQLKEKNENINELMEHAEEINKIHEKIKSQIEDDADREIIDLKAAHAKELREEQEVNVKLQGETSMLNRKLIVYQKEIDDLKHIVNTMKNEQNKLKRTILDMERERAEMRNEIDEREQTIQDKEKRILDLKQKNQELEKFKFILNFKINELQAQIEPKEKIIQEQTQQINEMVKELENLQRIILNLDLQLRELRQKLKASSIEIEREMNKNVFMKRELKAIKTDIYEASALVQDIPKLKTAIKKLYQKFAADPDFEILQLEDQEVRSEFTRQRTYLETSVITLKGQVNTCGKLLERDKVLLMQDNSNLLVETNILRHKYKTAEKERNNLQALLGLDLKNMPPKKAREKIKNALTTGEEIHNEYRTKIEEHKKIIDTIVEENERLVDQIVNAEGETCPKENEMDPLPEQ